MKRFLQSSLLAVFQGSLRTVSGIASVTSNQPPSEVPSRGGYFVTRSCAQRPSAAATIGRNSGLRPPREIGQSTTRDSQDRIKSAERFLCIDAADRGRRRDPSVRGDRV
jgi:hypothetical protein